MSANAVNHGARPDPIVRIGDFSRIVEIQGTPAWIPTTKCRFGCLHRAAGQRLPDRPLATDSNSPAL